MSVRTWNVNGENMEVGVVFGDQYHSTLGNVLSQENPHLLFIAILDLNIGKASLRTIHDNIHLEISLKLSLLVVVVIQNQLVLNLVQKSV